MTFSDIYKQFVFFSMIALQTACWAPEVEPPAPKLSPAEIAGLSIATASASSLAPDDTMDAQVGVSSQSKTGPKVHTEPQPIVEQENTTVEQVKVFPYKATIIGKDVPLLGHGGGVILRLTETVTQSAVIEVLEEQAGKARVLCRGCSTSHPFQAGWISLDYLKSIN